MQPGLQHVAIMDGLVPGQQYYYSYGDPEGGWVRGSFRAAPPVGPGTTVKILAVADMGQVGAGRQASCLTCMVPVLRQALADQQGKAMPLSIDMQRSCHCTACACLARPCPCDQPLAPHSWWLCLLCCCRASWTAAWSRVRCCPA